MISKNSQLLLNTFLKIEEGSFPEGRIRNGAKERSKTVRKFIDEFGENHVTINNYTNLMAFLSSITIDTFKSDSSYEDITIELGSETYEISATRTHYCKENKTSIRQYFDFKEWKWKEITELTLDLKEA